VESVVDEVDVWPTSLSPDGRSLAYRVGGRALFDLRVLDLATGKSSPLIEGAGDQLNGEISPDGRWLAYQSNEKGGRHEVYVRPFPKVGEGHWQVSTDGGREPRWSSDGRELFYRSGNRMMAAHVESDTAFRRGSPFELFRGRYLSGVGRSYDVAADGTFVMVESTAGEDVARVVLIQNLDAELKRRLSAE
jgi:Tol biopolymer transport system component